MGNNMDEVLKNLKEAVVNYDEQIVEEICKNVIKEKLDAEKAIIEDLAEGMEKVGELYKKQEYGIPEVLLSADVLKQGMALLKPHVEVESGKQKDKVVTGTVEGDIHSIGKNIVALMLEVGGFEVINLGEDVAPCKFIDIIGNDKNIIYYL